MLLSCCKDQPAASFDDKLKARHVQLESNGSASSFADGKLPVLCDLAKPTTSIGGREFSQLVVCGFMHLFRHHRHLNKINVFPVADGDTGSNMVSDLSLDCSSWP